MSATSLLHPSDVRVTALVGKTAKAFRIGPHLHPNRAAYDFYPTPPEATRALLSAEHFVGSIWEPACGQGHISKVLLEAGHEVVSTDFAERWGYGETGTDFLAERVCRATNIITNPPYGRGLGDAFVKHALALTAETEGTVAMLLNLASLAHPIRHQLWVEHPPSAVYILDELVCWPEGDRSRARSTTAQQRYCWVVWKAGHVGPTTIGWLRQKTSQRG